MYGGDPNYDDQTTLNLIAIVDPISQFSSVFIVPLFKRRFIIIFGCLVIATINILIAVFDQSNNNLACLILILLLVVATSILQEPVFQLYMTEVSNNSSLGLVHFLYYGLTAILSLVLPLFVRTVGPPTLYFVCGGMTFVGTVFQFFFIKETAHL